MNKWCGREISNIKFNTSFFLRLLKILQPRNTDIMGFVKLFDNKNEFLIFY